MIRKVKWGIAGLGNIANKFAADLIKNSESDLVAVASSDLERAIKFKSSYGAKRAYKYYDQLFDDEDVEVVYIASLNNCHKKMTFNALGSRKAVLCEKPLGLNTAEIKQMIEKAKNQNCFLMEALWSRFNPAINRAKKWIKEGKIGIPRFIYAEFSFYRLDADISHRLMDPEKGGGALLDIGIYPLFLAYYILGMPKKIKAQRMLGPTGVDIQTSMILQYENAQAVLYCGITNESDNSAKIGGTEGEVILHGRWHDTQKVELIHAGESIQEDFPLKGNGYVPQIEEVNRCLSKGKKESELWSHQDSLELGLMVEEVFEKIKGEAD